MSFILIRRMTALTLTAMSLAIIVIVGVIVAASAGAAVAPARDKAAKDLDGYDGIAVKAFTVDRTATAADVPSDLGAQLQNRLLQDLLKSKLFAHVVDASGTTPIELPDIRKGELVNRPGVDDVKAHRLILDGEVTSFSSGNRAARLAVGYGAGESKIAIRFTLRDAQGGQQLRQFDVKGAFKNGFLGGSQSAAEKEMSNTVGHKLVEEIRKNRSH